ncbi:hypothetical protein [Variovorax sp. KK3]|uniref:hypothetical protein n=1 Tax=Variovorax sp. KK3 TaxID=1855728 RepID=UPI00117EE98C|nr:hypothetical protein [Variovorax sp. KK3]
MKPFVGDANQGGRYVLPFQVEGLLSRDDGLPLKNAMVSAYGVPASQTLREAWTFRLFLNNGWIVDFSSACTGIGGGTKWGA